MKIIKLIYVIIVALLLSSCATTSFYQVYNVKSNQETITKTNNLFFEDESCKISYNLWSDGGNIGFDMYNKTDEEIHVKLNKTHFILNGFAYDYYKNRTFTTSENKSTTVKKINLYGRSLKSASGASSVENAVSVKEDSIVCIPAKTTKRISEYSINNSLVRDCDLMKYPNKKEIKTKLYDIEQSPVIFSNKISYIIGGVAKTVENKFYVSEITNYPESDFFELKYDEYCGQKNVSKTKQYKFYDIDKFYIKYTKGTDIWKH